MKIKDAIRSALKGNRYQSTVDIFPAVKDMTGSTMKLSIFEREFRRYIHLIPCRMKERIGSNNAIYNSYLKIVS